MAGKGERAVKDGRRFVALALCAAVLFALCGSSAFVAHEAAHPHDCEGADCPVCALIAQVNAIRRGLGAALLAAIALAAISYHSENTMSNGRVAPAPATLIDLKTRLND